MTRRPAHRTRRSSAPTRALEHELLAAGNGVVAGMDEVGRGALAGPVSVGLVVVDAATGRHPAALRDSKLLRAEHREELLGPVRAWCHAHAVGHASPAEIDAVGIIGGLRLAGLRALAAVRLAGVEPDVVVLDGNHDWLSSTDLFDDEVPAAGGVPPVLTRTKADMTCAMVAGASVLAKCERDALMVELAGEHPGYAWESNKGYSAPDHVAGLRSNGPCAEHRRSWRLPGVSDVAVPMVAGSAQEGMMDP